jgi:hypothetical protein
MISWLHVAWLLQSQSEITHGNGLRDKAVKDVAAACAITCGFASGFARFDPFLDPRPDWCLEPTGVTDTADALDTWEQLHNHSNVDCGILRPTT